MSKMVYPYDEVPRYRKRSGKKVGVRAGHRHKYSECLIYDRQSVIHREYCIICGRLRDVGNSIGLETNEKGYLLTNEEVMQKYNGLKMYEVGNTMTAKYISNIECNQGVEVE